MALCLIALFDTYAGTNIQSNEGSPYEKGYSGNVGLSISSGALYSVGGSLTTSHGYSFGNGLWMGGGISLLWPLDEYPSLPLFVESKYTFNLQKVKPFIACKVGIVLWEIEDPVGYLSPSFGVEYDCWSFFVSYDSLNSTINSFKTASLGFAWNFR